MKKPLRLLIVYSVIFISIAAILNINVSIQQGINFKVHTVRMPLYLKLLDFMDRHYNYKQLVKSIINEHDNEQERVMKIFTWTQQNIKKQPESLPVIDDHVWHIIIRGYGTSDQSQDVFTTLCNYAGINAFFDFIYTKDKTRIISLSFVKLNKAWMVFDSYNGVYFKNRAAELANIEQIRKGNWLVFNTAQINRQDSDYAKFLENLPEIKNMDFKRANIQSPLRRFIFQLKRWLITKEKK